MHAMQSRILLAPLMHCSYAGLTVAEHFRDAEGQDVLLFIDNIFRFTQVTFCRNISHHQMHLGSAGCATVVMCE